MTLVDISDKKEVEEILARAGQELENQIRSRTAELSRVNRELQREIVSLELIQSALLQRKKALSAPG